MKPERRFREGRVLPYLKWLPNCDYTPIQQVAHCGDPDYMLCILGKHVGLELKAEKGVLSKLQIYKLSCILDAGGYAFVATPSNWPVVKEKLYLLSQGLEPLRRYVGFEPIKIVKTPLQPRKRKLKIEGEDHD